MRVAGCTRRMPVFACVFGMTCWLVIAADVMDTDSSGEIVILPFLDSTLHEQLFGGCAVCLIPRNCMQDHPQASTRM